MLVVFFALLCGLGAGCGAAVSKRVAVEPAPSREAVEALPPGSSLVMRRPTPGVALLSLWIDAGARDAALPQVAAAAAFWAAEKVSANARVLAEGTELRLTCITRRESVARCASRLLGALELPGPSAADAVKLRERVRAVRARSASDDAQVAERLALSALFGEHARALFPLGEEQNDTGIDAASVNTFLKRHYVLERVLLVGLGDLEQAELDRPLRAVKRRSPLVTRLRTALALEGGLRVETAESGYIALALASASRDQAASLCQRFREIHGDASAHISLLHGATIAHLTLPAGTEPFARLQSAVFDAHRLLRERAAHPPTPAPDTLDGLTEGAGERWIVRGGRAQDAAEALLGVALLVRRDERTPASAAETLASVKERAQQAVEAGKKNSLGRVHGELSERGGRVTSANGATIEIDRRAGEGWFSAAVRMGGGSELDAPTGHGRAALLATLLASGCGIAQGRALDLRLSMLEARLTPLVDAEGLGVMISAPRRRALEALDLLLRCALRPLFQARSVEDARARLMQSLWSDDALLLSAALGQLLAPAAPGLVAPWGTPAGVSGVEVGELRRFHAQRAQAPNISVFITGDVAPREAAEFAARRLAHLSDVKPPTTAVQSSASPDVLATLVGDTRLRVVVGVRTVGGRRDQLAAQVFAAELEQALARRVGGESFALGASARGHSFAGVALTLRDEQIEATKAHTAAALDELAKRADAHFRDALIQAQGARNAALSSARGATAAAFSGQGPESLDLDAELALIRKLAQAEPSFFVLRPRP